MINSGTVGAMQAGEETLRLLDVVQFFSPISGGIRRYVEDKARFLSQKDRVSHCVVIPGKTAGEWELDRTRFVQIASPTMPGSKSYRLLLDNKRLKGLMDEFKPNVIELADPFQNAWTATSWARRNGARTVGFYHSDCPRSWARWVSKKLGRPAGNLSQQVIGSYLGAILGRMDALFTASRRFERYWGQYLEIPVFHTPLGFDDSIFHPIGESNGLRKRIGATPDEPLMVFAGRLAAEKRIHLLLDAYARLIRDGIHARLLIVGDGEDKPRLESIARQIGVQVDWLPYEADRTKLAEIYRSCDGFVHAGRGETFGLAVIEAAACGCQVVAFSGSGLDDASACNRYSKLVREGDVGGFAQAMANVVRAPLSHDAKCIEWEVMRSGHSTRAVFERNLGYYHSLCQSHDVQRVSKVLSDCSQRPIPQIEEVLNAS